MQSIVKSLRKINPRLVLVVIWLLISLVIFEAWMLVLRKPWAEYQRLRAEHSTLAAKLQQSVSPTFEAGQIADELRLLSEKLNGELQVSVSDDQMASALMSALDKSASGHGVTLTSMKPGDRKPVSVFEEVAFEVSAKGAYLQLCHWLLEFETSLGSNASVTEFDMKSSDEGRQVSMSLKLALYRPLNATGISR